jgi:hypothetical protein
MFDFQFLVNPSYETKPKWHRFFLDQTGRSRPEAGLIPEPLNLYPLTPRNLLSNSVRENLYIIIPKSFRSLSAGLHGCNIRARRMKGWGINVAGSENEPDNTTNRRQQGSIR